MSLTVYVYNEMPLSHANWTYVNSDWKGYDKYEGKMSKLAQAFNVALTVVLSVFSLGAYFIYLKYSETGRQKLANLVNRKISYYVKSSVLPKTSSKVSEV